jgi:PAS domain S-box-containing protein
MCPRLCAEDIAQGRAAPFSSGAKPVPELAAAGGVVPELEILGIPFARNSYPMWIYDLATLAFLEVNDAATKTYGYSRAEFLAMTLLEIRPSEDLPEFLRQTDHPRPRGQSTGELWRHKSKDGAIFPVIITSWELVYRGHKAELVLARRDTSVKQRGTCAGR